jgi:hypothetical protein
MRRDAYTSDVSDFSGWIGVAREDITPPVGIYARNWGAAKEDVATGIHRPLTLTALTLQTSRKGLPLVLIAADLGWWRTVEDECFVRSGVLDTFSLDPARVMINLSHTHAGPSICREDSDKPGGHLIVPYLERLREAVIEATRRALKSAQSATLTWEYGTSTLAHNRDFYDPPEERFYCGFTGYHLFGSDKVLVGRVTAKDGAVAATIVNYACHPTTLAFENSLISPDYVGAMRELVEAHTGQAPCLFLQGASGELAPREQYTDDTTIADSNGRQLGYAVLATLEGMLPPNTALRMEGIVESGASLLLWERTEVARSTALEARMVKVELPLKEMPSVAEIETELAACTDRMMAERLRRKLRVRRAVGERTTTQMPLWIWRVGNSILVGQANEAYSRLQESLRGRFWERCIAVMNVVNGHIGYLPEKQFYGRDMYAVWQTPFDKGSLERVIVASKQTICELLKQPKRKDDDEPY